MLTCSPTYEEREVESLVKLYIKFLSVVALWVLTLMAPSSTSVYANQDERDLFVFHRVLLSSDNRPSIPGDSSVYSFTDVELEWDNTDSVSLIYVNVCNTKISSQKVPLELDCPLYGFMYTAYPDGRPRELVPHHRVMVPTDEKNQWLVALGLREDMTFVISKPFLLVRD